MTDVASIPLNKLVAWQGRCGRGAVCVEIPLQRLRKTARRVLQFSP